MKRSFAIALYAIALAVALVGVAKADTYEISPPKFRESPSLRAVEPEVRADDDDYRLPNSTEPVHYDVELTTNVHTGERAFTGKVTINIKVNEATSEIVLHMLQLTIVSATITSTDPGAVVTYTLTNTYEATRQFLTLTPVPATTVFQPNTNWALTIDYTGTLRGDNGGFYLSTYTNVNNGTSYLATTQFESTDARHGFPCYDEPAKRATFRITINHSPTYNAISNMPVDEANSVAGKTVFQQTVNMPTYLVAFIVSDFMWTEGTLNGIKQRVYTRPGTEGEQEWALVTGMLLTERLGDYYGIKFALPKLDQVGVPDFAAGAMENWGLVTYREQYMLYTKEKSTVNTQTNIANIIAHEYTHQWFGNLVAIKWWTYLWLKESFATLYSYQAADDAYPEWDIWQMFHIDEYEYALTNDASNAPRAMTHYVQTPAEISRLYDAISYSKGGCVLQMWEHAITDTVFRRGLHNYLSANNYAAADEWQLFEAIQTAAKEENYEIPATISTMMVSWTQQGGYPLLTVERNYNDGSFTIRQEPFYNDATFTQDKKWYIPINYVSQSNPDFRDTEASHYLLNVSSISINGGISNDDWLILNKQSIGYYRINYDERNWNLITEGIIAKPYKVHTRNRAQLIHDAYRFCVSNRLSHGTLLNLMTFLKNEHEYAPWSTANAIITTFNRYLSGDADYEHFKFYIADLVSNTYDMLGANDINGEQHYRKYTRSIVVNIACLVGVESCLKETNDKMNDFTQNGKEIEPNLQSVTFCNGLKGANDNSFNTVYDQLMSSDDQARRTSFISALGCAQQQNQLKKFVESSTDNSNSLRTQERITLLSSAYTRSGIGLMTSIDFLDANWQAYAELTPGFGGANPLDNDIRSMSQYVVNDEQERRLLALVNAVKGSDKVTQTLETAVQTNINTSKVWLSTNRDPIMNWVSAYARGGSAATAASFMSIAMTLALLISRLF